MNQSHRSGGNEFAWTSKVHYTRSVQKEVEVWLEAGETRGTRGRKVDYNQGQEQTRQVNEDVTGSEGIAGLRLMKGRRECNF